MVFKSTLFNNNDMFFFFLSFSLDFIKINVAMIIEKTSFRDF